MTVFVEKSLKVLALTNDGDDLTENELKLVETAVNGYLSEEGEALFERMFERVTQGKPSWWLHGIEHLTADQEGFIFWRGVHVEHYDSPEADSSKEPLQEIARRCLHIESLGLEPNGRNVVWIWDWMEGLTPDSIWKHTLSRSPQCWTSDDGLAITYRDGSVEFYSDGDVTQYENAHSFFASLGVECNEDAYAMYHLMKEAGFSIADGGQKENLGFCFAPLDGVIRLFEKYRVKPVSEAA